MYMSTQMAQTSVKANSVRVLNSDADFASEWLPTFSRDFLVHRYIYDTIFVKVGLVFFRDMSQIVEKYIAFFRNV